MSEVQQLTYGLIVTLVGMGIVFLVLIGLSFMLDALKLLSNKGKGEKKAEVVKIEKSEEPVEVVNVPEEDAGELIAVISAALAACMGSSSNLVIKTINRVEGNTPVWAKAGRQEQMYNRL
ncbi:OadG family protein [Lutispora thermophila]|uniref:Sodium pump decarboxylases, gamma subunit n=1 Tax=Lutispora thermophila DSM 19022 TaxID=1122184 RepID=A0A1M6GG54_9FIRM|nr:OadG family protein [Lutispora thermophila]SHJ08912.1 sodium pump decarboxylases, gamma subunit [Lutispora thermophila DSM 19022]